MTINRFRQTAGIAALTLAGLFGAASSAEAAVYVGRWDPAFGGSFPDLSWSAVAEFNVSDACLTQGGTFLTSSCAGDPQGFSALFASVTFSDLGVPADPSETLTTSQFILNSFTVAGGELTSVMGLFGPVTPVGSFAGGGQYSFALELVGLNSTLLSKTPANTGTDCSRANPGTCDESTNIAPITGGKYEVVSAVPEPGTYAMLVAGLGMIGFLRRRLR